MDIEFDLVSYIIRKYNPLKNFFIRKTKWENVNTSHENKQIINAINGKIDETIGFIKFIQKNKKNNEIIAKKVTIVANDNVQDRLFETDQNTNLTLSAMHWLAKKDW